MHRSGGVRSLGQSSREQNDFMRQRGIHAVSLEALDYDLNTTAFHYSHCPPLMTGLAGSQGPMTTFLYLCKPINHQLHPPMPTTLPTHHMTAPAIALFQPPCHRGLALNAVPRLAPAPITNANVKKRCPRQLMCLKYLLNTGNSPNTSMLKRVKLKTCVVLGSLLASTVLAISAALVLRDAGNLTPTPPL